MKEGGEQKKKLEKEGERWGRRRKTETYEGRKLEKEGGRYRKRKVGGKRQKMVKEEDGEGERKMERSTYVE
jgi:hypothetical protein